MRMGATRVEGRLPPEHVELTVRAAYRELQRCYEQGATTTPELAGSVVVPFVVGSDGKVSSAEADPSSTLADSQVKSCVVAVFSGLSFAAPEDRRASVVYPIEFSPL
jgi:hypothetical protein